MFPELHEYICSQGTKAKKIIAVVLIAALLGVPYLISLHKPTVLLLTNHFNYLVSSRHENHQIPTAAAADLYVSLRRRRRSRRRRRKEESEDPIIILQPFAILWQLWISSEQLLATWVVFIFKFMSD
jgi:hypothetical protein